MTMSTKEVGGTSPGVLVLMPRDARLATGPVAVWLTAADWAEAAQDRDGSGQLVTPEGVLKPSAARDRAVKSPKGVGAVAPWKRLVPVALKTLRGDIRSWHRMRSFRRTVSEVTLKEGEVKWIWHHLTPFHDSGFRLAKKLRCPVVVFVDAPTIWEAKKWGVRRPGWGWLVEHVGDGRQLRRADLIACVSQEVAEEAIRLGAPPERTTVTPTSVNPARFRLTTSGDQVRQQYGLQDRLVIGWAGTFHAFHSLDLLLHAYADIEKRRSDTALLLVGDGLDRPRLEALALELELQSVYFTGAVPQNQMPRFMAAMDVATIVDNGAAEFHYSPLKLKEYLACGLAVIAPDSGEMSRVLENRIHALVVPAGDRGALVAGLSELLDDPDLRRALGARGRALVEENFTWDHQVEKVERALETLYSRRL